MYDLKVFALIVGLVAGILFSLLAISNNQYQAALVPVFVLGSTLGALLNHHDS